MKKKRSALGPAGLRRETFSTEGQPLDRTAQAQWADQSLDYNIRSMST